MLDLVARGYEACRHTDHLIQDAFMSELILHHYTLSPFSEKARAMLGLSLIHI